MTESPLKNLVKHVSSALNNAAHLRKLPASTKPESPSHHTANQNRIFNSHLTDKAILIHRPSLLPTRQPWRLRPHFLHILKHHVAMAIESLHARQQLAVVTARDQHL